MNTLANLLQQSLDDIGNEELFRLAFCSSQEFFNLSDNDLAEIFQVSRPTIGRWSSGTTSPHAIGRTFIIHFFQKIIADVS